MTAPIGIIEGYYGRPWTWPERTASMQVLARHGVTVHTAKISTLGELVEDTFLLSGQDLAQTASLVRLEQELLEALRI